MSERFDARALRKRMTPAERRLWAALRDGRLAGAKFRRQHPVGRFVLDFYRMEARLAVELDGEIHTHQAGYDEGRTAYLESYGVRVIRFQNDEVLRDLPGVLDRMHGVHADCPTGVALTSYQLEFPERPALGSDG